MVRVSELHQHNILSNSFHGPSVYDISLYVSLVLSIHGHVLIPPWQVHQATIADPVRW